MEIKNIKISLLIFFGLLLLSYAVFSMAEENSTSTMNVALDSDQDGLSDEEEKTYGTDPNDADTDNDGYSDGAEVQSGYDPLKPAPGDKIIDETKPVDNSVSDTAEEATESEEEVNLTEKLSTQVATLYSEKSAVDEEISIDDLDTMIQSITDGGTTFESLPEINDDELIIKDLTCKSLSEEECDAKEKEDIIEYLTGVSYIVFNNSPKNIEDEDDFYSFFEEITMNFALFTSGSTGKNYFDDITQRAEKTLEELKKIEVPEKMTELHKKALQLAKYGVGLNNETDLNKTDPVNNIFSLAKMRDFIGLIIEFTDSATAELEKYGVGINDLPINL